MHALWTILWSFQCDDVYRSRVASRSERPVQSVVGPRQVEAFRVFASKKYFRVVWRTSERQWHVAIAIFHELNVSSRKSIVSFTSIPLLCDLSTSQRV